MVRDRGRVLLLILLLVPPPAGAAVALGTSPPLCPDARGDAGPLDAALASWKTPERFIVLAGGDVTLGAHLPAFFRELEARGGAHPRNLRGYPFRRLAPLTRAADIFLVNLEGTLTRRQEPLAKNFTFRAAPEDVALLQAAGVDVVSLANNHAMDHGPQGLADTMATLGRAGIAYFGAGPDLAAARRPAILERQGLRVGFLGYLHLGSHSVEPPEIYAGPGRAGAAGAHGDVETALRWVQEDVRALRPDVDLLLVAFHWGWEGSNLVEDDQRRLAAAAAGAGADAVVGHHPHTLQGFTRLGRVPVAYSLGNLVFAGNWKPARQEAALLEIGYRPRRHPAADGLSGSVAASGVTTARLLPLHVDDRPHCPFQPYLLADRRACAVRRLVECYAGAAEEGECEAQLAASR